MNTQPAHQTTPTNPHTHIGDTILPRIDTSQNLLVEGVVGKKGRKDKGGDVEGVFGISRDCWDEVLPGLYGKPVLVLWVDATSVALEWDEPEETYTVEPTASIGFLWEWKPSHITIVAIVNTQHIAHGLVIPTGCITHIKPL